MAGAFAAIAALHLLARYSRAASLQRSQTAPARWTAEELVASAVVVTAVAAPAVAAAAAAAAAATAAAALAVAVVAAAAAHGT